MLNIDFDQPADGAQKDEAQKPAEAERAPWTRLRFFARGARPPHMQPRPGAATRWQSALRILRQRAAREDDDWIEGSTR
jgi:hypothetical protein